MIPLVGSLRHSLILHLVILDVKVSHRYSLDFEILSVERSGMELHDVQSVQLAAADRREALRRSMGRDRGGGRRLRRPLGRAVVALGLRIAGERRAVPARRYA
ncbi:MAG: hypothetical protein ACM33B_09490 [Pseudomonadota bacterium]